MSEFKHALIDSILTGENTRSSMDSKLIEELSESIKQYGVLQPILVRPLEDLSRFDYELIAGARRLKASRAAGLISIPCHVVEMNDEQALEAQITENLQRKDIHPMDECHAFHRLLSERNLAIADIAAKVGKSARYVAQRMKLKDLIPAIQEVFFADKIGTGAAIELAKLDPEDQKEIYDDDLVNWKDDDFEYSISDLKYAIRNNGEDLAKATFDLADAKISPSMGSCVSCQFNTACQTLLFNEDQGMGRCTNKKCFENKTAIAFERNLKSVIEDNQDVLLIDASRSWMSDHDHAKEAVKKLRNEGVMIIDIDKLEILEKPEAPEESDFDLTDADEKENYQDDLRQYQEELTEYEQKIKLASKSFIVTGNKKGEFVYTIPHGLQVENAPADPNDSNVLSAGIQFKITEQELKLKALDNLAERKIFDRVVTEIKEGFGYPEWTAPLTRSETLVLLPSLINYSSDLNDIIESTYGKDFPQYEKKGQFEFLKKLTDKQLNELLMVALRAKIKEDVISGRGDLNAYGVHVIGSICVDENHPDWTKSYQRAKTEVADSQSKRRVNIEKEILKLKDELAMLVPKTPAKKTTKKKSLKALLPAGE